MSGSWVFGRKFKLSVLSRMKSGENVSALSRELKVRSVAIGDRVAPVFFQSWIGGTAWTDKFHDNFERSIRAARTGGTVSLIGVLGGAKAEVSLPLVVMRNLRLQGVTVGSRDGFEAMCRAIGRHRMRPVVDRVYRFDDVPAAFAHLEAGRHFGKVCIGF